MSRGTSSGVRGALTAAVSRSVVPVKAAATPAGRPVAVNVSGPAEPLSRVTVIGMSRGCARGEGDLPGGTLSVTSGTRVLGIGEREVVEAHARADRAAAVGAHGEAGDVGRRRS